jgi:hypothetical protein
MMSRKYIITKGLSLNLAKQRVYALFSLLKKKPRLLAGAFLDFYFNYRGLGGTKMPRGCCWFVNELSGFGA